ncbi:unnamed protein product [Mytilus edulis]|uniref:Tc1-like transposase DDE domain-containing protein n=2 Tax=Mytilus TaxID=6548 RepID=A0A8B6GIV4_MYTGA|nr:unnamed protein product [Mytilus edulis]VDI64297.1 Hypothetical predicted protein [Mytilus galloprovincialis]
MAQRKSSNRLSTVTRQLILKYAPKFSALKISRLLEEKYDVKTSRQSVWRFLNRFKKSKSIRDPPRQRVRGISDLHIKAIDQWLKKDNELTANAIADKLRKTFSTKISKGYVSLIRRKLGWTAKRVKYCQLISHVNKEKRLHYAMKVLSMKEKFLNVIFVDESTVELTSNGRMFFYKPDSDLSQLPARKQKPKHSYKVHVWGGISYRGRTDVCIFTGIMDSVIYQQILASNFVPFVSAAFPDGYRLYQDNDSKHKSKSTKEWMRQNGVLDSVMETPASSPDLNPIENVWAAMKQHLQNKVKPRKKDELVQGIADFWLTLTPQKCSAYIDHLHRVLPYVILNHGGPSGF